MFSTLPLLLALTLPAAPQSLKSLQDRNRVLLVFGPNSIDRRIQSQLAQLDGKAMAARNLLLVIELEGWNRNDASLQISRTAFNSDAEQASLRRQFHIAPGGFAVVLIGKDGGEKFRTHTPVTAEQLNRVVDAMPMRQQEMKQERR